MSSKFKFCPLCQGRLRRKRQPQDEYSRLVCQSCGFIFYQNPIPTVLAVIEKGNKVLLCKRAKRPYKGYWDLPGGFVEIGQNLEVALKEEIKEELGVEVKSFSFFCSFPSTYRIKKMTEDLVGIVFKVKLKSLDFKPGSDVSQVGWFDKKSLPKLPPHPDVQKTFKKLLG